jgi:hypothetical protein
MPPEVMGLGALGSRVELPWLTPDVEADQASAVATVMITSPDAKENSRRRSETRGERKKIKRSEKDLVSVGPNPHPLIF